MVELKSVAMRMSAASCLVLAMVCGCTTAAATSTPGVQTAARPSESTDAARSEPKLPISKPEPSCGPQGLGPPLLSIPRLGDEGIIQPRLFHESLTDYFSQWRLRSADECCKDGEVHDGRTLKRARPIAEGWLVGLADGSLISLAMDHRALWVTDAKTQQRTGVIKTSLSNASDRIVTATLSSKRLYLGSAEGGIAEIDVSGGVSRSAVRDSTKQLMIAGETLDQLWAAADLVVQRHSGPPTDRRLCSDVVANWFGAAANLHVAEGRIGTCGELLDTHQLLVLSNAPGARAWAVDLNGKTVQELDALPIDFASCGSIKGAWTVITGRRGDTSVVAAESGGNWHVVTLGPAIGQLPVSLGGDWVAVGDPMIDVFVHGRSASAAGIVHLLKFTPDGLKLVARIAAQNPTEAALFGRQVLIEGNRLYIGEAGSSWYERQGGTEPAVSVYELK